MIALFKVPCRSNRLADKRSWMTHLHILIYPEVGMNPLRLSWPHNGLAPVQCNSWGPPRYERISDARLLSQQRADGATRRAGPLYRTACSDLPNMYRSIMSRLSRSRYALPRTDLGLRPTATIYWCGQSLYKYLPQFDNVFPRIALEAGDCQFAFIQYWQGQHLEDGLVSPQQLKRRVRRLRL